MSQPLTATEPSSALTLTEEDVRRLINDTTSSARIEMTDRIAGAYAGKPLDAREVLMAEQVFRLCMRDTEVRVRMALAQRLKESGQVPRDIITTLARDVDEVALPVLQYSEVLNDDDLMDIIQSTQRVSRHLAVSKRPQVSEVITGTLIEKGSEQVAVSLLENAGATISPEGFTKILKEYGDNETLMQAVSQRPSLPPAVAEKLVHLVSSSLSDSLRTKYNLPSEQIQKDVDKTRESETLGLIRSSQSQEDIDRLVNQLLAYDRLTPSLILSALCQGNFLFFETSLARLSNIPVANARTLITDRGELGFRAIYNKSGLPDAMFPAVKLLLRIVRELDTQGEKPGSAHYANRIVERILQYSDGEPIENLSYIIALVRRIAQ